MRGGYADRLGEEAAHERALRDEAVAKALGENVTLFWRVAFALADGTQVTAEVDDAALTSHYFYVWDRHTRLSVKRLGRERYREAITKAVEVAGSVAAEARAALEREQEDARSIAWLKSRGRLVEREGQWVLA